MCLLAFAYQFHPDYSLVIAANRDEFHSRTSSEARFWDDRPFILAGRDLQAGGTWLGITKTGRLAAVTNYREMGIHAGTFHSRGTLVTDFLCDHKPPQVFADWIARNDHPYQGFSLVFGTADALYYCSNRKSGFESLAPGIHGLSNRLINDDSYKVGKATDSLRDILSRSGSVSIDDVYSLLNDREQAPDPGLSRYADHVESERFYSSIFIVGKEYGTRCSTVILVRREGTVHFSERTFLPDGSLMRTVEYEFSLAR